MVKIPGIKQLGNKKEETVGIDIGSYSIKLISISKESAENTVNAYNIKRLPIEEKKEDAKAAIVKEALEEIGLSPERVNLSISGPDVIVRFIDLPNMSRDQLKSALVFEADKYIPFNIKEVVLDFIILGDAAESGRMRVLLAAAKRSLVDSRVKMVEQLGMGIDVLDIGPFAMFNAFNAANPSQEDKGNAFLDLGHSQTDVLISSGSDPCFMRQIQIGGKDITGAICRELSVTKDKADEYKRGMKKNDKAALKNITELVLDDLVNEMQLSFGYFENRYNNRITDIYCSGGVTYQEGVIEYLSERLGVEVKLWNPMKGVETADVISREDLDSVASQLAVCMGLALR